MAEFNLRKYLRKHKNVRTKSEDKEHKKHKIEKLKYFNGELEEIDRESGDDKDPDDIENKEVLKKACDLRTRGIK